MKIEIPCGHGVPVKVERDTKAGKEARSIRVSRGNLAQDWFKFETDESGHMAKVVSDDNAKHGSPILFDLTDAAKADGWQFAKPEAPKAKKAPAKASK